MKYKTKKDILEKTFMRRVPDLMEKGYDFEKAVFIAYNKEQLFLKELLEGKTARSQKLRKQLFEETWNQLRG